MNSKLLLVNGITLLYRESQLPGAHENSGGLVREIVQAIKLPEVSVGIDHEREILNNLKTTALTMCETPLDHEYELSEILQRLKINTMDEEVVYDALCDGMVPEMTDKQIKRTCLNIKRTLSNWFQEEKVKEIVNKAAYTLKFTRNKITDMKKFVAELHSQLEPYQVDLIHKDPAIISSVDMSKLDQVTGVFNDVQDAMSGSAILKSGWQGLNRMLDGGFRGGEEWVFGALQHNYKTGSSLSIFMDLALYNVPVMKDPTKKPAMVRISAEDPLSQNFQFMYQRLVGIEAIENGRPLPDTAELNRLMMIPLTPEQIVEINDFYALNTKDKVAKARLKELENILSVYRAGVIQEKLAINGYTTFFIHVNPSMWTYRDICNKIIELEADGYEIHAAQVDYLLKFPTTGCEGKAAGEDIRNMYERIANFMKARNILFQTPHQLSTDAKMRIREGRLGFVQGLVGQGFYAGCKQIDQVVDGELFLHIEKVNNKSYLTIQRGKHRKVGITSEEYLYIVLEFHPVFGLLPDIRTGDSTRKKVGGGVIGSGEEIPYWEVE
jgi:hypothetical protein